jgi:zinc protease
LQRKKRDFHMNIPIRYAAIAHHLLRIALVALCSLFLGSAAPEAAAAVSPESGNIVRATLKNGLRVIIIRNTLAPVVSTSISYLVGADETPPGYPGTAHAQEHMMFRGSPGLSAEQLANIGSLMGGSFNAETRQTVTQYYYTVPADDLDVALHVESLRMRDVLDAQKDWDQERGAIEQEVAQDLSNPQYILFTELRAALFAGTRYAQDALGTKPSFDKTTAAMLKSFHKEWYTPNNAILVVAGDLDPAATLVKIRELFGSIPARKLPERASLRFQPVKPQSLMLKSDLPFGMEAIAMRGPGLDSPDYPAFEVLSDVLSSERGALYDLVPQGKTLSAGFSFDPLPKAGIAMAAVTYPAGGDAAMLQREMRSILNEIVKNGVPPDLVAAAKLQERSAAEFEKNSIAGLATVWSEAVAVDGLDSPDEDLARIEKVTVEDVNRVARQYLDLDHAIVAVLTPQGSGKPVAATGFGGQESITLGETRPAPLPRWARAALERLNVPSSAVHPTVTRLPNGITLIVQPEDVSRTVTVAGHIRNRPELEVPQGQEGLATVLDHLFAYGSERFDRIALQRALDQIGASERAGTDFQVSMLTDHFERGVELLADNELHPALPESAFEIAKRQIADTVAGRLQSPGYLTEKALRMALLPKGDPSLREPLPSTVSSLTIDQVRNYYRLAFRPDLTVIVVIGDVTPEAARSVIEKYFGAWRATGPKPGTLLPSIPPNHPDAIAVPDTSRIQDEVTLGETVGITRSDPGYYALQLGNNVLDGGFYSTRLSRDLRKNAGLVYSVGSYFDIGKSRGLYFIQYACDPGNVSKVNASIVRELESMQQTPVTADELQRAKAMLLRQTSLDEGSVDDIARGLIGRWELDLPLDEPTIAAQQYVLLSADNIRAAFAKWIRPKDMVRVARGPQPQ